VVKKETVNSASNASGDLSRAEVDRMLSRTVLEGEGLGLLPSVVEALGRLGEVVPTEAEVQRFAAEAARLVPATPRRPAARASRTHGAVGVRSPRRRLALAGGAAALVLVLSTSTGVAFAANGAIPGDTLYGLDRALEGIGIGNGDFKNAWLRPAGWWRGAVCAKGLSMPAMRSLVRLRITRAFGRPQKLYVLPLARLTTIRTCSQRQVAPA
jgi:hypothetical protein